MDAVEQVMREDGYAALSARSVARCANLNYQLVFYYFGKIEDLFLATYQRRTQLALEKMEAALNGPRPLHAFWEVSSDPSDAKMSLEYMAMSNHIPVIQAETARLSRAIHQMVAEKLTERLTPNLRGPEFLTPAALGMAIAFIGGNIGFQSALGLADLSSEAKGLVRWCLDQLEPE